MGTDIHLYVEKLDRYSETTPKPWEMVIHEDAAYGSRNYDVFAVLADVRNGRGFAGCDTGDGFKPISEQRGLPGDISAAVNASIVERADHSHSWLLLSEVLNYDWQQTTGHRLWVQAPELLHMLKTGAKAPRWGCGGVSGRDVRHMTREELEQALLALGDPPPEALAFAKKGGDSFMAKRAGLAYFKPLAHAYAQVQWGETYEESCEDFLKWARALVDRENPARIWAEPNEIRLVFGFDS